MRRAKRPATATAGDRLQESASPVPCWKAVGAALNVGVPAFSNRRRASVQSRGRAGCHRPGLRWSPPTKPGTRKSVARRIWPRPMPDQPGSSCRRRSSREWRPQKNAPRIVHYDEPRSPCRLSSQGDWCHATKYANDSAALDRVDRATIRARVRLLARRGQRARQELVAVPAFYPKRARPAGSFIGRSD